MATVYSEFVVDVPAEAVWSAIRDVGAVHTRLARGFVTNVDLDGDIRTVTFANGFVVRERIVAIDEAHRRLAYASVGGRASHHNASLQVFDVSNGRAKLVWITDLLPDEIEGQIRQMVEQGSRAIVRTLTESASNTA
jgi:carbon monoxide dehydrogenase subunit G